METNISNNKTLSSGERLLLFMGALAIFTIIGLVLLMSKIDTVDKEIKEQHLITDEKNFRPQTQKYDPKLPPEFSGTTENV